MKKYASSDVQRIFDRVLREGYPELQNRTELVIRDMSVTGYSSPFTGKIHINLNFVNKHKMSKDTVTGVCAHELAHQISYLRRPGVAKWLWLWNYYWSIKKRRQVETEADKIAIERGYGKYILADAVSQRKRYANDPKRLKLVEECYPSPEEIREWLRMKSSSD